MGDIPDPSDHARQFKDISATYHTQDVIQCEPWKSSPDEVRHPIEDLLSFTGSEEVTIPGSFLEKVPDLINMPTAAVIDILGLSKSGFYRAKQHDHLEMETVDKVAVLLRLYQKGLGIFDNNVHVFSEWLRTPVPALGQSRPIDLLVSETGRKAVSDAIDRIEHGIYG